MTGEVRYVEKYSVAPAPSRDYYGIRILPEEVNLFCWKISHGPHRTPIVRSTSFTDFESDRLLQEEIFRVFGISTLQYVRDIIAGKTMNFEENSCGLTMGWNRVFKEGQLMQQGVKSDQCEKKRCVKARGRVPPTGVKGSASTRVRAKIVSKAPLEVIKKISVAKNPSEKSLEQPKSTRIQSHRASACARQVTEVSEEMLRMKVTNIVEEPKTGRETQRTATAGAKIDNTKNKEKLTFTPSKSTILNTGERLMDGLSNVRKKNVELADLIHEGAKRNYERSSTGFNSYLSCLEDIKRSTESSPQNYGIENPCSSNSSIASVNSLNEAIGNTGPSKYDQSYLTNQYKSAHQLLASRRSLEARTEGMENQRVKCGQAKQKCSISRIANPNKFSSVGASATRTLGTINKLATIDTRNINVRSSGSKNSSAERTISGLSKNQLVCREKPSESKTKTGDSRKK